MRTVQLEAASGQPLQILCIGAHCDDIEIGCAGTLINLLENQPDACIDWVVLCTGTARRNETEVAAERIGLFAPNFRLHAFDFRDGYLPYEGGEAKDALRNVAEKLHPDLIFTHYRHDAHQDHRFASEITWNLFRDHLILEYEIPKYDGDLGQPNVYVPLSEQVAEKKIELIVKSFGSQSDKHWFTEETFRSTLRLRGVESGGKAIYSEAFYGRKILFAGAAT